MEIKIIYELGEIVTPQVSQPEGIRNHPKE